MAVSFSSVRKALGRVGGPVSMSELYGNTTASPAAGTPLSAKNARGLGGTPVADAVGALSAASQAGMMAAYSIRLVKAGYEGAMVSVRRASDGALLDFYGDYKGSLRSGAGQTLDSWLAATTGFVATWYDQSGAGRHATQGTAAYQPQLVLDPKGGGKYVMYFSKAGSVGFSLPALAAVMGITCQYNNVTGGTLVCGLNSGSAATDYSLRGATTGNGSDFAYGGSVYCNGVSSGTGFASVAGNWEHLVAVAGTTNMTAGTIGTGSAFFFGSSRDYQGYISEVLMFSNATSAADAAALYATPCVPVTVPGLVGAYYAENWTGTQWTDASGAGNHVTASSGVILRATDPSSGQDYLFGNTASTLTFPTAILPATYTLFHLTRYSGTANRNRILTSYNSGPTNWCSGLHASGTGAHHNGWVAQTNAFTFGQSFSVATDQNAMFRGQGVNFTSGTGGSPSNTSPLTLNGYGSEQSDWACACILVYSGTLNATQILQVEAALAQRYLGSPLTSMGCILWLDGADPNSITAAGGLVSAWQDKSGANKSLSQGAGALQPTYNPAALNGLGGVVFDGTGRYLTNSAYTFNFATPNTIFVVLANATGGGLMFKGAANFGWNATGAKKFYLGNGADGTVASELIAGLYPQMVSYGNGYQGGRSTLASAANILCIKTVSTSSVLFYINSVLSTTSNLNYNNSAFSADNGNELDLGHVGGSGVPLKGTVCEVMQFNSALGDGDRAKIEAYLGNKWGAPVCPLAVDIGPYNVFWGIQGPMVPNARWLWSVAGSTSGNGTGIYIDFRITYVNTASYNVGATLYVAVDDLAYVYQNNVKVTAFVGTYNVAGSVALTLVPGANVFDLIAINGAGPGGLLFFMLNPAGAVIMCSDNYSASPLPNTTKTTVVQTSSSLFGLEPTPPLDRLAAATRAGCRGAFSIVRQSMAYAGPTVTLRRSSDNAAADFYANSNGQLGTALNGGGTALASWLGAATAYVAVWYDQSGKGNHATQAAIAAQPVLNTTTLVVDFLNGSRILNIPSNTIPVGVANAPFTLATRHGSVNNTENGFFFRAGVFANGQSNVLQARSSSGYYQFWYANDFNYYGRADTGNSTLVKYDGVTRTGYINSGQTNAAASSGYTCTAGLQAIGDGLNGQMYNAYVFGLAVPVADGLVVSQTATSPVFSYTPVLDRVTAATKTACRGAFSVCRLSMAYAGPTVNLRRSADNATADFYADAAGFLAANVNGTGTPLAVWLGGSTAYVAVWYDQSGSGNHATQTVAGNQPVLDPANLLVDFQNDSLRFMNMPSGTVPVGVLNAPYTIALKHGNVNSVNGVIISSGTGATNQANGLSMNTAGVINWWWNNEYTFGPTFGAYATGNRVVVKYDGVNRTGYINAVATAAVASSGYTTASGPQYLGKHLPPHTQYFNGQLSYMYIFGSAVPDGDRVILDTPPEALAEYPPAGLTGATCTLAGQAYGNGVYTVNQSSYDSTLPGWCAFNKATDYWHSGVNYTNGLFFQTGYKLNGVLGDWLTIALPNAITLAAYSILGRGDISTRYPYTFYLFGSNDGGSTWTLVDYRTRQDSYSPNLPTQFFLNGAAPYSMYGLVVPAVTGGETCINMGEMRLFARLAPFFGAPVPASVEYPPAVATGQSTTLSGQAYGNGAYTFNQSSFLDGTSQAWKAFNKTVGEHPDEWHSAPGTYTSGTLNSGNSVGGFPGEWLTITLPGPIFLTSYSLAPRYGFSGIRQPYTFYWLGSNDIGATWSVVDYVSGANSFSDAAPTVFTVRPRYAPVAYSTYALVIQRVNGSASNCDCVNLSECRLYGYGNDQAYYYTYTGANQLVTVPPWATKMMVQAWGAGGAARGAGAIAPTAYGVGGGGGYTFAYLTVSPSATLNVIVGGGGNFSTIGGQSTATFGGGGGCASGSDANWRNASGGGRSAVQLNNVDIVTAGGGGGAGATTNGTITGANGGPGGVTVAGNADNSTLGGGLGGTQAAGGATSQNGAVGAAATAGSQYTGGTGSQYGSGAGGGYFEEVAATLPMGSTRASAAAAARRS